jgi:hypothetical protein
MWFGIAATVMERRSKSVCMCVCVCVCVYVCVASVHINKSRTDKKTEKKQQSSKLNVRWDKMKKNGPLVKSDDKNNRVRRDGHGL